jgi:hypothetical protein
MIYHFLVVHPSANRVLTVGGVYQAQRPQTRKRGLRYLAVAWNRGARKYLEIFRLTFSGGVLAYNCG